MAQLLDDSYGCSGTCETAIFPFSQNLTAGIPTTSCAVPVQKEMDKNGPTIVMMLWLGFVITLIGWICQFTLWCKHEPEPMPEKRVVRPRK